MKNRGFTLIELIIIVAILAVVLALLLGAEYDEPAPIPNTMENTK